MSKVLNTPLTEQHEHLGHLGHLTPNYKDQGAQDVQGAQDNQSGCCEHLTQIASLEMEFGLTPGTLSKAAADDLSHVSATPERLRAFASCVYCNVALGRWKP